MKFILDDKEVQPTEISFSVVLAAAMRDAVDIKSCVLDKNNYLWIFVDGNWIGKPAKQEGNITVWK